MSKLLAGVFLLSCTAAHADTLTLRDGTRVDGAWAGVDANQVSFLVNGQEQKFPRAGVTQITFGPDAASRPAPIVFEPDAPGVVYLRDESGDLKPLEQTRGIPRNNPATSWEMSGPRSPVRIRTGQKVVFLVRGVNAKSFSLFPLDSRGGKRITRLDPRNRNAPLTILVNVTTSGKSSYALTPVEELPPGEYAFSASNSPDAYCFTVEP